MAEQRYLRFAWWNVHDFAHFDPNRVSQDRWPYSQAEYDAKCARVDTALRDLIARHSPDVLGLCEITEQAAEALRSRLFPDYQLICPAAPKTFQVAVLFRPRTGFRIGFPLQPDSVPRTTRDMPVVNYIRSGHHIRFIFCHWTAFGENSRLYRQRSADRVAEEIYDFLHEPGPAKSVRHAIVVGDMNEEPFDGLFSAHLVGVRDRERSTRPLHTADHDTRRVRLYNPSWRLLGERHPHGLASDSAHHAGTYYNEANRTWHTYDQVLVSGSLLGSIPPFLDEAALGIMVLPGCLDSAGRLRTFHWNGGHPMGLSDHLPLVGQILLPGS